MTEFTRYAVYFTPDGPLATFGAGWLGWDLETGAHVPHPDIAELPSSISELTDIPRKYGLHGTIKPPFRLADGTSFDDLNTTLNTLCATQPMLMMDGLRLAKIGSFLALIVDGDQTALSALAFDIVQGLDAFRAPASKDELERRRAANLTPHQDAHLLRWGYPYVGDEFKFHITLSGRNDPSTLQQTHDALLPHLDPILPKPFVVRDLSLVGEDVDGRFHLIRRVPLEG